MRDSPVVAGLRLRLFSLTTGGIYPQGGKFCSESVLCLISLICIPTTLYIRIIRTSKEVVNRRVKRRSGLKCIVR